MIIEIVRSVGRTAKATSTSLLSCGNVKTASTICSGRIFNVWCFVRACTSIYTFALKGNENVSLSAFFGHILIQRRWSKHILYGACVSSSKRATQFNSITIMLSNHVVMMWCVFVCGSVCRNYHLFHLYYMHCACM